MIEKLKNQPRSTKILAVAWLITVVFVAALAIRTSAMTSVLPSTKRTCDFIRIEGADYAFCDDGTEWRVQALSGKSTVNDVGDVSQVTFALNESGDVQETSFDNPVATREVEARNVDTGGDFLLPACAEPYRSRIHAAATAYGLDPSLVGAIIEVESAGEIDAVSSSGAIGLMQVMPMHLSDPTINIHVGTDILARCTVEAGGDLWGAQGALARYYGLGKPLTLEYVRRVSAAYLVLVND